MQRFGVRLAIVMGAMLAGRESVALAADAPSPSKLFPAPGSKDVCIDAPLRINFPAPPTLGTGRIQIFDAATNAPVEVIDVAVRTKTKAIGGVEGFKYYPIIITGNQAAIYPSKLLERSKSYYVTVDGAAFRNAAETLRNLDAPQTWLFTTKAPPPAPPMDASNFGFIVAADGTGDFCTVQGALDAVPEGERRVRERVQTTIFVRNGTYNEIIFCMNKDNLRIIGEDRKKTIIAYANNEGFNRIPGNPFGAAVAPDPTSYDPRKGDPMANPMYHRSLLLAHRCKDLTIANLTLHNTTPKGGGQAEAIMLNGTPDARAILINVDLDSFQDTLQINGQAYLSNCYIQGDTDFLWGTGPCFFENCQLRSLNAAAFTQVRNPTTNHGFAFLRCRFEGAENVKTSILTRIDSGKYPASECVLLDCVLTDVVGEVAWQLQRGPAENIHFWEYNTHRPDGTPVDVSKRAAVSRQLTKPADAETIANYSNPTWFLGEKWTPQLAPIVTQPPKVDAQKKQLSATAIGIPEPTYQWSRDGADIPGATQPVYMIGDSPSGTYRFKAINKLGSSPSDPVKIP